MATRLRKLYATRQFMRELNRFGVTSVIDAGGGFQNYPQDYEVVTTLHRARLTQAGIIPVTTNVVLGELQRTWNRPDAAQWGAVYSALVPHYRAVAESYQRAQEAAQRKK